MQTTIRRRTFLKQSSAASAAMIALGSVGVNRAAASPNDKLVVGIMGCNGRGMAHIAGHLAVPNIEIGYICDGDRRAVEKGIAPVAK